MFSVIVCLWFSAPSLHIYLGLQGELSEIDDIEYFDIWMFVQRIHFVISHSQPSIQKTSCYLAPESGLHPPLSFWPNFKEFNK